MLYGNPMPTISPRGAQIHAHGLHSIDLTNTLTHQLRDLLALYPAVDPAAMGFPQNWHLEPLWQN